jgi:hypothetical protein
MTWLRYLVVEGTQHTLDRIKPAEATGAVTYRSRVNQLDIDSGARLIVFNRL